MHWCFNVRLLGASIRCLDSLSAWCSVLFQYSLGNHIKLCFLAFSYHGAVPFFFIFLLLFSSLVVADLTTMHSVQLYSWVL